MYDAPPPPPPAEHEPVPYSVGDAFNWGWRKFQQNVGVIILGMLIYGVGIVILYLLWAAVLGMMSFVGSAGGDFGLVAGFFGSLVTGALMGLVIMVASFFVQAGIVRAALAIADGRPVDLPLLFSTDGLATVAIGAILLGIGSTIGYMFCFIPGLIVIFFGQFFVHFAVDKGGSAIDAISASFSFVNRNLATIVFFYLASIAALFAGALLCGVGILVAFPVVVLAQAYTFRRLQGEPIAAA